MEARESGTNEEIMPLLALYAGGMAQKEERRDSFEILLHSFPHYHDISESLHYQWLLVAEPNEMADDIIVWQMHPKNSALYITGEKAKDKELISEQVSSELAQGTSGH